MVLFIGDSSCDMYPDEAAGLRIVPMNIYTEERAFLDDPQLNVSEMMDYLAGYKARSYTSCPSTEQWMDMFDGGDEIYIATLTSALSGTYNSALIARDMYLEEHPDAKFLVVDSLSTGGDLRLLVEKMMDLKAAGLSYEEVCAAMEEYQKHTRLFFAFKSLHNLAQNGRLPKIAAAALGVMNITVIGTASEEGHVKPTNKARGDKKVIATLIKELKDAGYKGGRFRLGHGENPELAERFAEALKETFGTKDILVYPLRGLTAYYGERGGLIIGAECE